MPGVLFSCAWGCGLQDVCTAGNIQTESKVYFIALFHMYVYQCGRLLMNIIHCSHFVQ